MFLRKFMVSFTERERGRRTPWLRTTAEVLTTRPSTRPTSRISVPRSVRGEHTRTIHRSRQAQFAGGPARGAEGGCDRAGGLAGYRDDQRDGSTHRMGRPAAGGA